MKVRWHCLALEGFGKYMRTVRVDFSDGLNTLVSANESGKSTLTSGLAAVLYGLANSASRDGFSTGRFLNWGRPERFRGGLLFSSGDKMYRIERQFESNSVALDELVRPDVWQTLATGEHNPRAHKRNRNYEETLVSLIGVGSRDLFERTFMVTQPLPESDELDVAVQELLSGGGAAAEQAISILEGRIREVTKFNTSYGVGTTNARSDRQLDVLEKQISEAQIALREEVHLLDELPEKQSQLHSATARRRETEVALRQLRATLSALTEWHAARTAYETAVRQKGSYQKALEHLLEVSRRAKSARDEIAQAYASFAHLPPDTGERLLEMQGVKASLEARNEEIKRLSGRRERLHEETGEYERRLSGEYADVAGRKQLVVQLSELKAMCAQLQAVASTTAQAGRSRRGEPRRQAVSPAMRALASLGIGAIGFVAAMYLSHFGDGSGGSASPMLVAVVCAAIGALVGWMLFRPGDPGDSTEIPPAPLLAELRDQINTMRAAVSPFDENSELRDVQRQIDAAGQIERLREIRDAELSQLDARLHALDAVHMEETKSLASLERLCGNALRDSSGSVADAITRWRAFGRLSTTISGLDSEARGVLEGLGASTEDDLRQRLADADTRVRRALDMWEALVSQNPALPAADLDTDPHALRLHQQALQGQLERLELDSQHQEKEVLRLSREVQALELGQTRNIAQLQERLLRDTEHAATLRLKARSIAVAHREMREARSVFQSTYKDTLADRITGLWQQISGVPGRRVVFDDEFRIGILVDSQPCSHKQLSQGARDQMYIAVRLAIADVLALEAGVPLMFDDPFLTFDDVRLLRMRDSLHEIAATRQVIMLSHREEIALWGRRIDVCESARWPW